MELLKKILDRFWSSGALFIGGFLLIIYIAFGFLYFQQGAQQKELEKQIAQVSAVIAKPLASAEELQSKVEAANLRLAPMKCSEAVAKIVEIAEKSGINVDPLTDKLRIPPVSEGQFRGVKVGGGSYKVLSISGIRVQGDYDSVMAFLSDLDSGKTLENMVLKRVTINDVKVTYTGEEGTRRAEFAAVMAAVVKMMDDNGLEEIPAPMGFTSGVAANLMGDDPDTEEVVEGFPDNVTTAAEKGYTGAESPRDGYVLYQHARISTDNTTQFKTIDYLSSLETVYFYTCEADGTVRQFDGASVALATEYFGSEGYRVEVVANVDVEIYTK